jgi:hypothetical protein
MALPPHHPFWLALLVVLTVAAISAVLVYARVNHMVKSAMGASFGTRRSRLNASVGMAGAALLVGGAATGLYLALLARWSELAPGLYLGFAIGGVLVIGAALLRNGARSGMRGIPELITLTIVWALAYGLVLPALMAAR